MRETSLLPNPTATVYLDGLIFLLPNSRSGLCRAMIHTGAKHHELQIEITQDGIDGAERPPLKLDWNGSQKCLRAGAPYWLYVDSGGGRPDTFSTSFYKPDDLTDERSFGHLLDFETRLYDHALDFHERPPAAELNFAHGTFYSATNLKMLLKSFSPNETVSAASTVEEITSSVLVGVDFDAKSDESGERHLVLEQTNPSPGCTPRKEIFRLKLVEGKHHVVKLLNVPAHGYHGSDGHSPEAHFLLYYELFSLREDEGYFFVKALDAPEGEHGMPMHTEQSPPCNVGVGGITDIP